MSAIQANTKEWLEARRGGLGASDAPAALGFSRWKSPQEVCLDKWGEAPEVEQTKAMKRGHVLEPFIAQAYRDITGLDAKPCPLVKSKRFPWMIATPDLIIPDEDRIVQIKTTLSWNRDEWGESGTDEIPEAYRVQVMHEMAVTEAASVDVVTLFAEDQVFDLLVAAVEGGAAEGFVAMQIAENLDLRIFHILRDFEAEEALVEAEREFWEQYVVPHVLPKDFRTAQDSGATREATREEADLISSAKVAAYHKSRYEAELSRIKDQLQQMIGEDSGLDAGKGAKVTWKRSRESVKEVVDWEKAFAAVVELSGVALEDAEKIKCEFISEKKTGGVRRFCWPRSWREGES